MKKSALANKDVGGAPPTRYPLGLGWVLSCGPAPAPAPKNLSNPLEIPTNPLKRVPKEVCQFPLFRNSMRSCRSPPLIDPDNFQHRVTNSVGVSKTILKALSPLPGSSPDPDGGGGVRVAWADFSRMRYPIGRYSHGRLVAVLVVVFCWGGHPAIRPPPQTTTSSTGTRSGTTCPRCSRTAPTRTSSTSWSSCTTPASPAAPSWSTASRSPPPPGPGLEAGLGGGAMP